MANALLIALYCALAASVAMRVSRGLTRGALETRFDPRDRRLVGMAAFYLAAPLTILSAQLVQVALLRGLGASVALFESWIYVGVVEPSPASSLDPLARALVAATGMALPLLVAAVLLTWTRIAPGRAARNHFRLETGRALLMASLGLEPVVSLLAARGNTTALRLALNEHRVQAGDAALLVFGLAAALTFAWWRRADRLRALGTPLHDAMRAALARLATHPDDVDALRALGAAWLAQRDPRAVALLERAALLGPEDPRIELLLARAYLDARRAQAASERLRRAGAWLERDGDPEGLLVEVTLSLSAARLALGDAEGAILTAEAARERAPRDPRTLLGLADALVAGGRRDEARRDLESALSGATGTLRQEIERRLAALGGQR